jgi:phage repressor protein C with HTH and peptisase S24 domain
MNWHRRLTAAREARNIKKSAFAKLVGVSAPTVTDWESGQTKMIEGANLMRVCAALAISPTWLLEGTGEMADGTAAARLTGAGQVVVAEEGDPDFYQIPKVKLELQAGITGFQTIPDIYDGSKLSVAKNWVDRNGYFPDNLIALSIKGESMEPNLYQGDQVIVNTGDTRMEDGAVFAVNYEGEAVIKRLVRDRGEWWLASDNPDQRKYNRKSCRNGECIIVGRVVRRETDRI